MEVSCLYFVFSLYRYREILLLLLTEILKKIQFTYNQSELEELDNEELNEDVRFLKLRNLFADSCFCMQSGFFHVFLSFFSRKPSGNDFYVILLKLWRRLPNFYRMMLSLYW